MTEETAADISQETTVENSNNDSAHVEPADETDMGRMIREAFAKQHENNNPDDIEDDEKEPDLVEDQESDVAGAEIKPEPSAEVPPRGRRAIAEYEKRIAAEKKAREIENNYTQKLAKLEADNEAMRKLFDALTNTQKSDGQDNKAEDVDGYLKSRGLDPDNFLDEEAKKAAYTQFKELDELKSGTSKAAERAEAAQFENVLNNTYNSLADSDKMLFSNAAAHVILTEIQQMKALNPSLDDKQAYDVATKNYNNAMLAQYRKGENPINFIYNFAVASGFKPGEPKQAKTKPSLDPDRIEALRKRAGAPNVDTADTGGMSSGGVKMDARAKRVFDFVREHSA